MLLIFLIAAFLMGVLSGYFLFKISFIPNLPKIKTHGNFSNNGYGPSSADSHVGEEVVGEEIPLNPEVSLGSRTVTHTPSMQLTAFSSFLCSAGNQVFEEAMILPQTILKTPVSLTSPRHRLCMFNDVCIVNGAVTYYLDDTLESVSPIGTSIQDIELFLSAHYFYHDLGKWKPNIVHGPRPTELAFAPEERVYVLDELTYSENFAHLLIDNLLSAYAAFEVFGLDITEAQIIGMRDCDHFLDKGLIIGGVPSEVACKRNVASWTAALFTYPYLQPPYRNNFCVRKLVAGQGPAFALSSSYAHRSTTARLARHHAYTRLGISEEDPIVEHKIIVLLKRAEHAAIQIPDLCSLVEEWALGLNPTPMVECFMPATLDIPEQLQKQVTGTVYVVEAGSTGYGAVLFARPSASLISLVSDKQPRAKEAKEAQVFLFTIDVQVWYYLLSSLDSENTGAGALLLALERSGQRFNLPPIVLVR